MIVSTLIKILIFYFVFILLRNLLKGASKVNQVKQQMDRMKENMNSYQQGQSYKGASKSEDVVEAEFRHL